MLLYKENADLVCNYSCYHIGRYRFENLEKDILKKKNCEKISNFINEWASTYKKRPK